MALIAVATEGRDFPICPEDTHFGICTSIIDLGLQKQEYLGVEKGEPKREVKFVFTFPDALREDGRPFSLSTFGMPLELGTFDKKDPNVLSYKSKLYKFLNTWRGTDLTADEFMGLDLKKLHMLNCGVSVIHQPNKLGKVSARINTVNKLLKGAVSENPLPSDYPCVYFDTETATWDDFNKLDSFTQKDIQKATNWVDIELNMNSYGVRPILESDIPDEALPF
jgi:hypothetical protein